MGITATNMIWDGRRGQEDLDKDEREWTVAWRVQTDDPTIGPKQIRDEIRVQAVDYYSYTDDEVDTDSWLRKIEVHQDQDDPLFWIGLATYSNEEWNLDPLLRPAEVFIDGVPFNSPLVTELSIDANNDGFFTGAEIGRTVLNTATDPFDPPIEVDDSKTTIRIVRNEAVFTASYHKEWNNTVNKTAFRGFAIGTLKLGLASQNQWERGVEYFKVTYTLQEHGGRDEGGNPLKWDPHILNRGFRYRVSGAGALIRALDGGTPVSQPVMLAANGDKLAADGTPIYLDFVGYKPQEFADLLLPTF